MVMIDEIAVSRSFGTEAVIDVHTTEGMKRCGLAADSKLGQTWREDLAVMLAVPGLSRARPCALDLIVQAAEVQRDKERKREREREREG